MLQSSCQIPFSVPILQADFHPRDNSVLILLANGSLLSLSEQGEEKWRKVFPPGLIGFRTNLEGSIVALLGKETLHIYNKRREQQCQIPIFPLIRLIEFMKNKLVLSGFTKKATIVKLDGKTISQLTFRDPIFQLKPVPLTNRLFVYDAMNNIVCLDHQAKKIWSIEHQYLNSDIIVSERGKHCYALTKKNSILHFDINGKHCFEITQSTTIRHLILSLDGRSLLTRENDGSIKLYNHQFEPVWSRKMNHIQHLSLSRDGQIILAVDRDNVLSLYDRDCRNKEKSEFIELDPKIRVEDKTSSWTRQPGSIRPKTILNLLTVNETGNHIGLVGLDHRAYLFAENGIGNLPARLPALISNLAISPDGSAAFVFGNQHMLIIAPPAGTVKHICFSSPIWGQPVVNFDLKKIYVITRNKELCCYNFEGKLADKTRLTIQYVTGLSCSVFGAAFTDNKKVTLFSDKGIPQLNVTADGKIVKIIYCQEKLIIITEDCLLLLWDPSCLAQDTKISLFFKSGIN